MNVGAANTASILHATATAKAPARPVTVDAVAEATTWDGLIGDLPFAHLPQTYAYGEGKRAKGWTVRRFLFRRAGEVLAMATVLERHVLRLRVASRVNRGPMFFNPEPDANEVLDVYGALRRQARGPLLIAPALPHGGESAALLRRAGFRLRHDNGWTSGRIDLVPPEQQIWAGLASTFRNRVRQSEKLGAELRISGAVEDYAWMLARHAENMREKGFGAADGTLLEAMRVAGPDDVLVFQLVHRNHPVAGMSVVRFGAAAEYHVGWVGPEGRRFNGGNFLMWSSIKEMKRRGVAQFDVGGLRVGDGYTRFKQTMKPVEFRLAGEWMSFW